MPKQDAITLLKADHAAVKKLFAQEEKATKADDKKQDIFDQIKDALTVHATIEEEIFYPAVKKARSEHVKDEVREGYEEHKQIKTLLAAISGLSPEDETWDMKVKVLKYINAICRHRSARTWLFPNRGNSSLSKRARRFLPGCPTRPRSSTPATRLSIRR
jgi:hemerythrin superfamily protein